jgi:predicted ester cyclase
MPYLITYTWYPPALANNVAQRYLEVLQKYPIPSYIKRLVPAANSSGKDGLEALNIDEVKEADLGKAMTYMTTAMVEFRDIEGFRYEIRIFLTVVEGLKLLGMG